jgi:hypothetical protein
MSDVASDNPALPAAPPLWRVRLGALWPSMRRSAAAIFSLFALPLFLLSVISLAKILDDAALIELGARLRAAVEAQTDVVDDLLGAFAQLGWTPPRWLLDLAPIYLSLGSTTARAERDGMLATEIDSETRAERFKDALRTARIDYLFFSVPDALRGPAVRLLWPFILLYRLQQPYVVDGPGPTGDEIVTTVPAHELRDFVEMVSASIPWGTQTLYDQRQIIGWQVVYGAGAVWLMNWVSGLF